MHRLSPLYKRTIFLAVVFICLLQAAELFASNGQGYRLCVTRFSDGDMVVIDSATHKEIWRVDLGAHSNPAYVTSSPDYKRLFVSARSFGEVWVIDVESRKVIAKIKAGLDPHFSKVTPDGKLLVIANNQGDYATVVDMKTLAVVGEPRISKGSSGVAISPDSRFAYISAIYDGDISVIDLEKMERIATIKILGPNAIANPPGSPMAYFSSYGDSISILDTRENRIIGKMYVGYNPFYVAFSQDGTLGFISNGMTNVVTVLDLKKQTEVEELEVGSEPGVSALSPDGKFLFVTNYGAHLGSKGGSISVIDVEKLTEVDRIKPVSYPRSIAVLPAQ